MPQTYHNTLSNKNSFVTQSISQLSVANISQMGKYPADIKSMALG